MVKNTGSETDMVSKNNMGKGMTHRIKEMVRYFIFLSLLETGIAHVHGQTTPSNNQDKQLPQTEKSSVVTDHKRLINTTTDSLSIETIRNELLVEMNQEREKKGLDPLVLNPLLTEAAMKHAQYMDKNNRYDHRNKQGESGAERVQKAGYTQKIFMGENIHNGPRSIYYVMRDWMQSSPHAKNILREFSDEVGIGYVNGYWVIDFGGRYPRLQK